MISCKNTCVCVHIELSQDYVRSVTSLCVMNNLMPYFAFFIIEYEIFIIS